MAAIHRPTNRKQKSSNVIYWTKSWFLNFAKNTKYNQRGKRTDIPASRIGFRQWSVGGENPFADGEFGTFYGRSLSVWSALLELQSLLYDGPASIIGFRPPKNVEDHAIFFSGRRLWIVQNSLVAEVECLNRGR